MSTKQSEGKEKQGGNCALKEGRGHHTCRSHFYKLVSDGHGTHQSSFHKDLKVLRKGRAISHTHKHVSNRVGFMQQDLWIQIFDCKLLRGGSCICLAF